MNTSKQVIPIDRQRLWYALLASANACTGFLFFTYNLTIFNALLPFLNKFVYPEQSDFVVVFTAAAPLLTGAIASIVGGKLAPYFGRRKIMMFTDIVAIIGVILTLFEHISTLITGRLLIGLAIGATAVVAPLYFTEVAPVDYRGEFTNLPTIFGAIGILFATLLGLLVPGSVRRGTSDGTWRILLALSMLVPIFRLINFLLFFRYETPYYYVNKNNLRKAVKILRNTGVEDTEERIKEINAEKEYMQKDGQVKFIQLFSKRFRLAVLVCIIIMSLQYLSGLNLILVYTGGIYSAGITEADDFTAQTLGVITSMVNFFSAIVSIWTTSQFGRRPLIVIGTFLCGVCLTIYGILALAVSVNSIAPKIFLVLWPLPWNLSLGSVLYVIVAESLPDVGVSIATLFNWIFSYLTLQFFPNTQSSMGLGWTFIMFGLITIGGALILFLLVVETRGKNKDEILKLYSGEYLPAKVEHEIEEINKQKEIFASEIPAGPHVISYQHPGVAETELPKTLSTSPREVFQGRQDIEIKT